MADATLKHLFDFPEKVVDVRSIFIPTHRISELVQFMDKLPNLASVILGNSDRNISEPFSFLEGYNLKFFVQNLEFSHDDYSVLPIGLENYALYWNGIPKNYSRALVKMEKANRVLVGPFSPTHSERLQLRKFSNKTDSLIDYLDLRLFPHDYSRLAAQYKFVAAPQGNGRDTHRFWEALYRGSYPIVLKSEWSKQIRRLGIPIVEIDTWSLENVESILETEYPLFDPAENPALWAEHWSKKFELSRA